MFLNQFLPLSVLSSLNNELYQASVLCLLPEIKTSKKIITDPSVLRFIDVIVRNKTMHYLTW